MTAAELRARIEADPECRPHWSRVFEVPDEPEPQEGPEPLLEDGTRPPVGSPEYAAWDAWASVLAQHSAWRVKTARAGILHPDAAEDLARIFRARGEAALKALGVKRGDWQAWTTGPGQTLAMLDDALELIGVSDGLVHEAHQLMRTETGQ